MKNQAIFSSKDKSETLKCCLLQFLFGALRVNREHMVMDANAYASVTTVALALLLYR